MTNSVDAKKEFLGYFPVALSDNLVDPRHPHCEPYNRLLRLVKPLIVEYNNSLSPMQDIVGFILNRSQKDLPCGRLRTIYGFDFDFAGLKVPDSPISKLVEGIAAAIMSFTVTKLTVRDIQDGVEFDLSGWQLDADCTDPEELEEFEEFERNARAIPLL